MLHDGRLHFKDFISCGTPCRSLSLRQPVFWPDGRSDGQTFPVLFTPYMNNDHRFQLDAIPTIGFSDPFLSYLSAVQFTFDGARMLKEGYEKVIAGHFMPFLVSNSSRPYL